MLLIFKLDTVEIPEVSNRQSRSQRIIEDIAKVRHIAKDENGSSVALELTGLNDDGINELIRATNEVSISRSKRLRIETHPKADHRQNMQVLSV